MRVLLGLIVCGFLAAPACADHMDAHGAAIPPVATSAGLAGVFHVLDCTNEGYVNHGEVIEHGGSLFRNMDTDDSKTVSRAEYVTFLDDHWADLRHAYFDAMDPDGDGFINHFDFNIHLVDLVTQADLNNDGDASWTEILTLRGETDGTGTRANGYGRHDR